MKLVPRHNQAIGRIVIKRILSAIVRPDETKNTTKFVLDDSVGAGAEAEGIKVGDVVLPVQLSNIMLDGGASFRPIVDEKDVRAFVTDVTLEELMVQTDNGGKFVSLGDTEAAQSLCKTSGSPAFDHTRAGDGKPAAEPAPAGAQA